MTIRRWASWIPCILALACASGPQRPERAPDVLLLVVDGLRADAAPAWIEAAGLSEWLGGEGVLSYGRAYAPSSLGVQSLAALLGGRMPTHGGAIGLAEAEPAAAATTLATTLRRGGYRTGLVSQAAWAARPGFARGFDDLQVALASGWSAQEVAQRALQVVDDWRSAVPADAPGATPWLLVVHWTPFAIDGPMASQVAFETVLADAGAGVAALRQGLEERGALSGAVVALTAGHGFERNEHGGVGAGWTVHEEAIRVPLVVRGLASAQGVSSDAPISTLALAASLRELAASAGQEVAEESRVAPLPIAGAPEPVAPVISELVVRERAIARAVIEGDLKYLRILKEVPPQDREVVARGYEELQAAMLSGSIPTPPLFGEPVRELLVRVGPEGVAETELPLADHRQELSRLRALLRDYQRLCEEGGWAPPEITERLLVDLDDVEQLEILGYM
ncbi:MAG TPA: hypothetical protein VMT85_15880 [Thermoanaerobaculia bacterium]|nr:hypothetical protein [Thermoanaerobaculia bacterium]